MLTSELAVLDRLVRSLERADDALRFGSVEDDEDALAEGLAAVSFAYGSLHMTRSAAVSARLEETFDACLLGLANAYAGQPEELAVALTLARSIRVALAPQEAQDAREASERPTLRLAA